MLQKTKRLGKPGALENASKRMRRKGEGGSKEKFWGMNFLSRYIETKLNDKGR